MEATLLTEDQIWGENALEVMKAYGARVGLSDLAVLQAVLCRLNTLILKANVPD